jgi:hypothetical protein
MNNEIRALVSKVSLERKSEKSNIDNLVNRNHNDNDMYDITVLFDVVGDNYQIEKKYLGIYDSNKYLHFFEPISKYEIQPLRVGTYVNIVYNQEGILSTVNITNEEPPLVMRKHRL